MSETQFYEPETLVDRLQGIYRIPIKDGLGPVQGSEEPNNPNEFVRTFTGIPGIQKEAARRIRELEAQLESLKPTEWTYMLAEKAEPQPWWPVANNIYPSDQRFPFKLVGSSPDGGVRQTFAWFCSEDDARFVVQCVEYALSAMEIFDEQNK
jgi:hypothetical protein